MAGDTTLVAALVFIVFAIGAAAGVIFMVATRIRDEEKVARERARARLRATTLYEESTSNLTQGVHSETGMGHYSGG